MNNLKAGFARRVINPKMGIDVAGYFKVRKAEGILDDLYCNVLALSAKNDKALIITVDNLGIKKNVLDRLRGALSKGILSKL